MRVAWRTIEPIEPCIYRGRQCREDNIEAPRKGKGEGKKERRKEGKKGKRRKGKTKKVSIRQGTIIHEGKGIVGLRSETNEIGNVRR